MRFSYSCDISHVVVRNRIYCEGNDEMSIYYQKKGILKNSILYIFIYVYLESKYRVTCKYIHWWVHFRLF